MTRRARGRGPSLNLHGYPSTLEHESRMLKESGAIRDWQVVDEVVLVGTHERELPRESVIDDGRSLVRIALTSGPRRVGKILRALQVFEWQIRVIVVFWNRNVAMFNAHNLAALPIGWLFKLFRGTVLVYDTHEVESERDWPWPISALGRGVERMLAGRADLVIAVSDSSADWYRTRYSLKHVLAVRNFPSRRVFPATRNQELRPRFGIPSDAILFIYQGLMSSARGTDTLLQVFSRVSKDRHILFLGFGPMEADVRRAADAHDNVHFHPAVPPDEILRVTSAADVGFHLLDDSNRNHSLTMGNKPFEYMACGIPVIESRHTEVARLIAPHDCAWFVDGRVDELVALVNGVQREEIHSKSRNALAARHSFTWERELEKMKAGYTDLLRELAPARRVKLAEGWMER